MTPHSNELSDVLEVSLFGALRIRCQGRSVDHFQTRQTALLLAYLVTYPRRHSRDELVDLLWPGADPASGRPRLSQVIWRLRQALHEIRTAGTPEVILADRAAVGVERRLVKSDHARFRQGILRASATEGTPRWRRWRLFMPLWKTGRRHWALPNAPWLWTRCWRNPTKR